MSWGAIAAGAAALIGGYMASEGSKDAARTQVKGGDAAIAAQLAQFMQTRQDLAPMRESGTQALNSINAGLGLEGYYPGVTKPLSYEEWIAKNPDAATGSAGGLNMAGYGAGRAPGTIDLLSGTDPLGLYSGGERSVERALDPLGLFGGGKKKKKPKPPAPGTVSSAPKMDPRAAYDEYVKNFKPGERPTEATPFGDFNRDFTIADFEKDPGYQFRMNEGTRAVEGGASARGGLLSGRAGKELERYGQDYASGEYSNAYNRFNADRNTRFNRLATVAGIGQTATSTGVAAGTNTANNVADTIIGQANARAAGRVGQSNAVNDTINTLGNFYLQRRYGTPAAPKVPQPVTPNYNTGDGGWYG